MGRPKLEDTRGRSIRLPDRLWSLLKQASADMGLNPGRVIWSLVEDFLVKRSYLKKKDRKRQSLKGIMEYRQDKDKRLRQRAGRLGLTLEKTTGRDSEFDSTGYWLTSREGTIVTGRYGLTLPEIERFLAKREQSANK